MKLTRFLAWLVVACLILGACDRDDGVVDSTAATVGPVNGLIAYSHDGDIYVGDPATGTSVAIVSGLESDINSIFSPDGSRIAFVRGMPARGPASLIVVRSDGSDGRVVVPEGFGNRGIGPFAWTPNGLSLVAGHDSAGHLSLIDASGAAEPRLLTPPLPAQRGAMPFGANAQVAPMFRPPAGDVIMGCCWAPEVFDADLTLLRQLDFGLAEYRIFAEYPTWSPDGAMILVSLSLYDPSDGRFLDDEMVVMDPDGGHLLRLGPGSNPMWSPDSASIAYEDFGPDWDFENPLNEVRIAALDLASGTKRVLESTISPVKVGAAVETVTNNEWHTWYYEGWSWSPDGRSLLLLKDHRTRPVVVDVATDTATELPWETDSFPSWQRKVAP